MPIPPLLLAAWAGAKGWAARSAAGAVIRGGTAALRTQRARELRLITKVTAAQTLGMNSTNPQRTKRYIENGVDLIESTSSHLNLGLSRSEFLDNAAYDLGGRRRNPIVTGSGPNGGSSTSTSRNYRRSGRTRHGKRSTKGTTAQKPGKDKGRPNPITLGPTANNPTYSPGGGGFMPE